MFKKDNSEPIIDIHGFCPLKEYPSRMNVYVLPDFFIRTPSSQKHRPPTSATNPPTTHRTRVSPKDREWLRMELGVMKMPDPIISPTTTAVPLIRFSSFRSVILPLRTSTVAALLPVDLVLPEFAVE